MKTIKIVLVLLLSVFASYTFAQQKKTVKPKAKTTVVQKKGLATKAKLTKSITCPHCLGSGRCIFCINGRIHCTLHNAHVRYVNCDEDDFTSDDDYCEEDVNCTHCGNWDEWSYCWHCDGNNKCEFCNGTGKKKK